MNTTNQGASSDGERAASAPDEIPEVVSEGTVKLGDLEVRVLHLSNGERVIDEQSFHAILFAIFGPDASAGDDQ